MEILLLFLTGTLMGALLIGSFALGYYVRDKKGVEEEGVHFNKNNQEFLTEMAKWANYNGKNV